MIVGLVDFKMSTNCRFIERNDTEFLELTIVKQSVLKKKNREIRHSHELSEI